MLLEWRQVDVPESSRETFDADQRASSRIRYVDGLVVRVGGFDVDAASTASVLTMWRDDRAYARFVQHVQGAMLEASDSEVVLFDVVSRLPGQRPRLVEAMAAGRLLRVDTCVPQDVHGFVRTQLDVWTPGMASARGMFGGVFARRQGDADQFIVATAWEDEALHEIYAEHHVPELKRRAGENDEATTTRRLALERHWKVLGVG